MIDDTVNTINLYNKAAYKRLEAVVNRQANTLERMNVLIDRLSAENHDMCKQLAKLSTQTQYETND